MTLRERIIYMLKILTNIPAAPPEIERHLTDAHSALELALDALNERQEMKEISKNVQEMKEISKNVR